jgi:hypothetical protein
MSMHATYYFPPHVHFALERDAVVFMDLRTDQYSMLLGPKARAFESLLSSAPDEPARRLTIRNACASHAIEDDVLSDLLDCQLVTRDRLAAGGFHSVHLPRPESSLLDSEEYLPQAYTARDLIRCLVSCLFTKWRLSNRGIERTLRHIEWIRRKSPGAASPDMQETRRLVSIFNLLRPLFPKDYVCLFDSISLLDFLARYHCFPRLVFAVTLDPWAAHCWVQDRNIVFNEDPETASKYLRILVV